MNPGLPVALALSLCGLLVARVERWQQLGRAWLFLGLVVTAFLTPVWRLSDGMPSPSAILGRLPPWQQEIDTVTEPGNTNLVDVTFQIEPWMIFLRRQVRQGEWPFWNPHQFAGAPFWPNGQAAPLSPFHLLFVALPLQLGFVLVPWLRLFVAALGSYTLARSLLIGHWGGLVAGVIFPLSGFFSSFLLFPMANALCLVPWILWVAHRILEGRGGFRRLAVLVGLQWLGGHPETVVHTAMLVGVFALTLAILWRRDPARPSVEWRAFGRLGFGWGIGTLGAAAQWLPLLINLSESSRWQSGEGAVRADLGLLLPLPLRLFYPGLYGHPADGDWWGPFDYNATAVFVGSLGLWLALLGVGVVVTRRRAVDWSVLSLVLFSAALVYQAPLIYDIVIRLPVLGRLLHHRLLFGVDLGLALLAAMGHERWLEGRGRKSLLLASPCLVVMMTAAFLLYGGAWRQHDQLFSQALWAAWTAVTGIFLVVRTRLPRRLLVALASLAPLVLLGELFLAHAKTNPPLSAEKHYPSTGAIQFLQGKPGRIAAIGHALRPNSAMVYGLLDIRGDDTLKAQPLFEIEEELSSDASPVYWRPISNWQSPWLDRLDVRWVVAGPGVAAADPAWRLVYDGEDGRVFERPTTPGPAWWKSGSEEPIVAERRGANGWHLEWQRSESDLLVLSEAFDRGWRTVGATHIRMGREAGYLLAVPISGGHGVLELRYRPRGLLAGCWVSAMAWLILLGALLWSLWRRRRRAVGHQGSLLPVG